MSGSTRRPVLRPFWASTRKSQGAASGRFLTKARRFGSRRAARKAAKISASCSGRWQSRNRPPSRRARRAQSTASAVVQLPVWRASARRGSGLRGPAVKYGGLQAVKSYCPCSGPAVQSCRRSPQTGAMCAASVFSARAAAQRADAAGSISSAVQGPRCPASCQTSETMPHPLHRSSARSFLRGCAKRASSSASVPNVAPGAVSTRVPLSRISTPIQAFARSCAYFSSATWVLLSLIVPSITRPRASSNGILTTSRNSPASRCCAVLCRPVAAHR